MAADSSELRSLVESIKKHAGFKRLAAYSLQSLSRKCAPPTAGWQGSAADGEEDERRSAARSALACARASATNLLVSALRAPLPRARARERSARARALACMHALTVTWSAMAPNLCALPLPLPRPLPLPPALPRPRSL